MLRSGDLFRKTNYEFVVISEILKLIISLMKELQNDLCRRIKCSLFNVYLTKCSKWNHIITSKDCQKRLLLGPTICLF